MSRSRIENNMKRMKALRQKAKRQTQASEAASGATAVDSGSEDSKRKQTPSAMVIDKSTGEVREGGMDIIEEFFKKLDQETERCLSSTNPCYLVGRVRQNDAQFTAVEVKQMVDATFECACRCCFDAWYPNQYALGLAFEDEGSLRLQVAYFLSNFELGLRRSAERAVRHLGENGWMKESEKLAARLDSPAGLDKLTPADLVGIKTYVSCHPNFDKAMAWYEAASGKAMRKGRTDGGYTQWG